MYIRGMKKLFILGFALLLLACSSAVPDSDAKRLQKKTILRSTSKSPSSSEGQAKTSSIPKKLSMKLISTAFAHNGNIPAKYTCDGADVSPPLAWTEVPEGSKSFVLIHDDPDAVPVAGYAWDHWILYNIPAETRSIPENSSVGTEVTTSFGTAKYGGPCPPNGEHKYYFKLYALDTMLNLKNPRGKKDVEAAMKGHILAQAELIGKYNRKK